MSENIESPIWFSHIEDKYIAETVGEKRVFDWTGRPQVWNWSNCTVSWVRKDESTVRVVIRSAKSVHSEYRRKDVTIRYMLGFDVDLKGIKAPEEEGYQEPLDNLRQEYGQYRLRWIVRLDGSHSIWQWKEDKDIKDSEIYRIYREILHSSGSPPNRGKNFFNVDADDDNEIGRKIVPVVYQPAIDSWDNFVREVHCHVSEYDDSNRPKTIQVTILFNNEQLREHALANRLYEWFRLLLYGRLIDVESFFISARDGEPEDFDFPDIYSGENNIQQDDIHIKKYDVTIKYYFGNGRHPVIFVNTSNHAMAEHDTNHRLWKWEYIAWQEDGPIDFGEKSREQINRLFRSKLR